MPDSEPRPDGMRREGHLGGVRLVGIFVPWQAVALTLAVLVGITALAVGRWTAGGETRVHLSSADESTTFTYAGDHTTWGYSPPPDKLYSVEFTPVSAPGLFCQASIDRPGETQGVKLTRRSRRSTSPPRKTRSATSSGSTSGPMACSPTCGSTTAC